MERQHSSHPEDGFRLRGKPLTRIDALSDMVFGLALTLLVVSLEVPRNFSELHEALGGLLPFAVSFAMLLTVWYAHYLFSRRYGLEDRATIVLNSLLLFVVLFYVYPLKFLFLTLFHAARGGAGAFAAPGQVTELMVLYGVGFAAVYLLLAALYANAWRQRETLELDGLERLLTVSSIVDALGLAAIGLLASVASLLLPAGWSGFAGYLYFLIAPWKTLTGTYFGRKARALRKLVAAPTL